ncbi:MAG: hypothetical protein Q4C70_03895 [Planctomycetia bacterium]|nr:hypothetical protein [Planctomycetia bacterium]
MDTPNKGYDHVYVILRYDEPLMELERVGNLREVETLSNYLNTVKVVLTEEEAVTECERLNTLYRQRILKWKTEETQRNPYFWMMSRIKKGSLCPTH